MSGPAILKLSAWGARIPKELHYNFPISVSYLTEEDDASLSEKLKAYQTFRIEEASEYFFTLRSDIETPLELFTSKRASIASKIKLGRSLQ